MYELDALRQDEFPHSAHQIYFNHASISPLPERTRRKMNWVVDQLAINPSRCWTEHGVPMTQSLEERLANLINAADPEEIVPITSTSAGINALAQAINWNLEEDNMVFCEVEFPSNAYPWLNLGGRHGLEVRQATAVDGGLTLDKLKEKVDEDTKLVTVSALQFFSGHRTDLLAIGRFCHERDILFVVDAIQSIGHFPIDVQAMHIDALVSGGQKSILGPPGTGFMYVRRPFAETLRPRFIGPNATVNYLHWLDYDLTLLPAAQRFGSGTPNLIGMFGLHESVGLLQELGIADIDQHTRQLATAVIEQLQTGGYEVITPLTNGQAPGPIVTFRSPVDNEATDALIARLAEENAFVVKQLDRPGNPHLRLSFHCYNTLAEVERFVKLLGRNGYNVA
jgi:cysteine desulfurase / selenocysteine lyase